MNHFRSLLEDFGFLRAGMETSGGDCVKVRGGTVGGADEEGAEGPGSAPNGSLRKPPGAVPMGGEIELSVLESPID
jgi:hypothetical protein